MNCPRCQCADTAVIDSRDIEAEAIRRRRKCLKCRHRFTTYERIEPLQVTVAKKNGRTEPYSRDKVIKGMALATEKRNIAPEVLERIANELERKFISLGDSTVSSVKIGNFISRRLRALDDVAYIRFTSVYKRFTTRHSFEKELEKLSSNNS